jgi:hypothetical protein
MTANDSTTPPGSGDRRFGVPEHLAAHDNPPSKDLAAPQKIQQHTPHHVDDLLWEQSIPRGLVEKRTHAQRTQPPVMQQEKEKE